MNWREANLKIIKENKWYLYSLLEKSKEENHTNNLEQITNVKSKTDVEILTIKKNGTIYRLNSMYNPIEEAKRWAEQYEIIGFNKIFMLYGLGNGLFLRAIKEKLKENYYIFVYEPCAEIFYNFIDNYDCRDILEDRNISITVEGINDLEFMKNMKAILSVENIKMQSQAMIPQYDKVFVDSARIFISKIKQAQVYLKININTANHFSEQFIENYCSNIKYIRNSNCLKELREYIPTNIPAIIVAAGPSVKENIEGLKRAKGRSVIIAVDRVLDYLLENGVHPDFVCTEDPVKDLKYYTRNDSYHPALIVIPVSGPEIMEFHKGRKFFCDSGGYLDQIYKMFNKEIPIQLSSPSVATMAFANMRQLGLKTYILVGQDLAYDGEYSHIGSVVEAGTSQVDCEVESINGGIIRSRSDWRAYKEWFEEEIEYNESITVVDTKARGALISGTVRMNLDDAVEKYCTKEISIEEIINNMPTTFSEEDWPKILDVFIKDVKTLSKLKLMCEKGIKICNKLIKDVKSHNIASAKEKKRAIELSKINKYLTGHSFMGVMEYMIESKTNKYRINIAKFEGNVNSDAIKTYSLVAGMFEAVIETIEYTIPFFEEAVEEMKKSTN